MNNDVLYIAHNMSKQIEGKIMEFTNSKRKKGLNQ